MLAFFPSKVWILQMRAKWALALAGALAFIFVPETWGNVI